MAEVAKRLTKPVMRGLLIKETKMTIITAFVLSFAAGGICKVFGADARKKRYAEFYKTYDAEEEFQKMKDLGLFTS